MRPAGFLIVVSIVASLGGFGAAPAQAQDGAGLSFKEALAKAREHAIDLRVAKSKAEAAQLSKALAEYENDPTVEISATAGANYREVPSGAAAANAENVTRQQSYGLSIGVPLYDFGRHDARREVVDSNARLAALDAEVAEESLRLAVARAYLDVWTATRTVAVTEQQLQVAQSKLSTQTRNYKMGLRPESDVVTAEVDLGRADITRLSATDTLIATQARLADLTGDGASKVPASTPPQVANLTHTVDGWGAGKPTASERRQAVEGDALNAELNGLRAKRRPSLAAVVSAEEAGTLSPLRTTASAQVRLSWDIPWSGMGRAEEDILSQRRQTLELATSGTQRDKTQATRLARDSLNANVRLAGALDNQLKLAERQMKLVQSRYEAGQASALEVSTAENTLLTIRLDQIRAGDAAVRAALNIAEAQGVSDLEALFP